MKMQKKKKPRLQTAVSAVHHVPGALGLIVSLSMPKDGHLRSSSADKLLSSGAFSSTCFNGKQTRGAFLMRGVFSMDLT